MRGRKRSERLDDALPPLETLDAFASLGALDKLDPWRDLDLPAQILAGVETFDRWQADAGLTNTQIEDAIDRWLPLDQKLGLDASTRSRIRRPQRFRLISIVVAMAYAKATGHSFLELAQRMDDAGRVARAAYDTARTHADDDAAASRTSVAEIEIATRAQRQREHELLAAFQQLTPEQQSDKVAEMRALASAAVRARISVPSRAQREQQQREQQYQSARERLFAWADQQPVPETIVERPAREKRVRVMRRKSAS